MVRIGALFDWCMRPAMWLVRTPTHVGRTKVRILPIAFLPFSKDAYSDYFLLISLVKKRHWFESSSLPKGMTWCSGQHVKRKKQRLDFKSRLARG